MADEIDPVNAIDVSSRVSIKGRPEKICFEMPLGYDKPPGRRSGEPTAFRIGD
jgi:hypothetical protein